jgi:hypothetical protein
LPSKTKITQGIAFSFVGAKRATDFQKTTPQLDPQEQNFSDAVKAANPNAVSSQPGYAEQQLPRSQQKTPNVDAGPLNQQIAVPRLPSQLDTMPGKQSKASKAPKKKKADYTPALLPGQTSLGQL